MVLLKSDGNGWKEWVYDLSRPVLLQICTAWRKNETVDGYQLESDGKWLEEIQMKMQAYQVVPKLQPRLWFRWWKLSISQGSVVWLDMIEKVMTALANITISGLSGYMKNRRFKALDASKDFIPIMRVMATVFITMWLRMLVSQLLIFWGVKQARNIIRQMACILLILSWESFPFKDLTEATNYSAEELIRYLFTTLTIAFWEQGQYF